MGVRDDGPGIPAAALPRVFERFFRVDPSRAGDHSGLGLAIVDQIARAHGGRSFGDNVAGAGARVGVLLPTLDVERIRVRPLQPQGSRATSGVPGGR